MQTLVDITGTICVFGMGFLVTYLMIIALDWALHKLGW